MLAGAEDTAIAGVASWTTTLRLSAPGWRCRPPGFSINVGRDLSVVQVCRAKFGATIRSGARCRSSARRGGIAGRVI